MIRSVIQAGFGNQLFQYATGYALAQKLGQDLELDISFFGYQAKLAPSNLRVCLLDKLNIGDVSRVNSPSTYWQYKLKSKLPLGIPSIVNGKLVPFICEDIPNCRMDQSQLFSKVTDVGACLFGFWQNTVYFEPYLADIRKHFVPNYEISREVTELQRKIEGSNSVGVHIRRGDFVGLGWDKGASYYQEGMDSLKERFENVHFFIVTDDVKWVNEQFGDLSDITIIDVNTPMKDIDEFYLLSSCHHQIISESTFGWWAAYLNPHKDRVIICPEDAKGEIFKRIRAN